MKTKIIEIGSYAKTLLQNELYLQDSDTLAVILPGNFYTIWGPSLYYATNIAFELGLDTLLIEYGYQKVNIEYKEEDYQTIVDESYSAIKDALAERKYKRVVIIGKSFGTSVTSCFIDELRETYEVVPVLITPTKGALEIMSEMNTLIIVGDQDHLVKQEDIEELEKKDNVIMHVVKDAGHDLDAGSVENSIEEMKLMNMKLKQYLRFMLQR